MLDHVRWMAAVTSSTFVLEGQHILDPGSSLPWQGCKGAKANEANVAFCMILSCN